MVGGGGGRAPKLGDMKNVAGMVFPLSLSLSLSLSSPTDCAKYNGRETIGLHVQLYPPSFANHHPDTCMGTCAVKMANCFREPSAFRSFLSLHSSPALIKYSIRGRGAPGYMMEHTGQKGEGFVYI